MKFDDPGAFYQTIAKYSLKIDRAQNLPITRVIGKNASVYFKNFLPIT